jgi:hypothetical protein
MVWHKAKWIDPFFAALNERFPERSRGTDGTIGDPDHQDSPSGHNPDDTPGSKPERTDADSKPEVRAADASSSLGDPRHGMQAVVDAIVRTPADRSRLIYIIFNGSIWRAAGGWRKELYGGSDKHRTHVHLSGHPDADDDGAPWTSILTLGGTDMAGEYSPDTACALAIGATSAGDVASTAPGWDGALSVYNLRAMTTGQRVSDNAPVTGEETRKYNLRVIVEEQAELKDGQVKLAEEVAAVAQAVAELRELVGAGGTDPQVLRDAAFDGAQRAERE